jgi:hypothetical protein
LTNLPIAGELSEKREIQEIFFDLKHIHHGWDKDKRDYNTGAAQNSLSEDDVVSLFEQLGTLSQTPIEQNAKKKSVEHRFIFYVYDGNKRLKMVVDLMKNDATVVVIIY